MHNTNTLDNKALFQIGTLYRIPGKFWQVQDFCGLTCFCKNKYVRPRFDEPVSHSLQHAVLIVLWIRWPPHKMADVVLLSFQVCMWCVDINSKGRGLSFAHSIWKMWMKSHVINLLKVLTIFQPSCYLGTVMYIYTTRGDCICMLAQLLHACDGHDFITAVTLMW